MQKRGSEIAVRAGDFSSAFFLRAPRLFLRLFSCGFLDIYYI